MCEWRGCCCPAWTTGRRMRRATARWSVGGRLAIRQRRRGVSRGKASGTEDSPWSSAGSTMVDFEVVVVVDVDVEEEEEAEEGRQVGVGVARRGRSGSDALADEHGHTHERESQWGPEEWSRSAEEEAEEE